MIAPPAPPKTSPGFATAEGRELRLEARPSARFNSPTKTTNCINFSQPDNESEMTCLLRTLRCLFSMSQREGRNTPFMVFAHSDDFGHPIPSHRQHPSACSGFFCGFCAFLRPTLFKFLPAGPGDVFPTRVGMVRFFRRWGTAPLKRGSFVFIGVHSWSLPAIKPQK
jgi:hypothetical protein